MTIHPAASDAFRLSKGHMRANCRFSALLSGRVAYFYIYPLYMCTARNAAHSMFAAHTQHHFKLRPSLFIHTTQIRMKSAHLSDLALLRVMCCPVWGQRRREKYIARPREAIYHPPSHVNKCRRCRQDAP